MPTSTVEDYLKQLYEEEERVGKDKMIPMGRLAAAMGVVPGTATSMVKALSDSGLVEYEPRGGVRLTAGGEQLALHVIRRHRLLELFLVKVLNLDWSVVHDEAETLEHVISDRVLERIDVLLGRPKVDPHGDAIPTSKGQLHEPRRMSLADCATGAAQRVARVLDESAEFLQFIERTGLMPGTVVTVEKREKAAEIVIIRLDQRHEVSLSLSAAAKVLVEAR